MCQCRVVYQLYLVLVAYLPSLCWIKRGPVVRIQTKQSGCIFPCPELPQSACFFFQVFAQHVLVQILPSSFVVVLSDFFFLQLFYHIVVAFSVSSTRTRIHIFVHPPRCLFGIFRCVSIRGNRVTTCACTTHTRPGANAHGGTSRTSVTSISCRPPLSGRHSPRVLVSPQRTSLKALS